MITGNFAFLKERWPILANLGEMAEKNVHSDPNTTLIKLRLFAEMMAKFILAFENMQDPVDNNQNSRLRILKQTEMIPVEMLDIFHTIRSIGNKATHEAYGTTREAGTLLSLSYRLGGWFMQVYGDWSYEPAHFVLPKKQESVSATALQQLTEEYEARLTRIQEELQQLSQQQLTPEQLQQRRNLSRRVASQLKLTEKETRQIIDDQLRSAGWEVNSEQLKWPATKPAKNRYLAIAEWPCGNGYADYALFVGFTLLGIIEAKKKGKDVISDLEQAKEYARQVKLQDQEQWSGGPWGDYKVPFLFATNGRPYLKQLETKSGIWFLDTRKNNNHPRALHNWYTPEGLQDLLKQDKEAAHARLKNEPLDYLNLRPYQLKAIKAVEAALGQGQREILIAMATGTGKTRTTIGLTYRLIKSQRFKRILFLVDRSALGEQAGDAFKEAVVEDFLTFTQIYDVKGLEDKTPEPATKVHIATIQGMIRRVLFREDEDRPAVDWYDCIVVDEAHRGYVLDREMGETELTFRDQQDYISKYRKVLEYFDAVKIGLTATPALHTKEIFNDPVFTYSYRDAVVDGYLVDHEPPYQFETQLKQQGIKFTKGQQLTIYDPITGQVDNINDLPDELHFEVDKFNKTVITENFNRTILGELVNYLDPMGHEKTLIFAAGDDHADMVVKILKEEFEAVGIEVEDDAIVKITASVKDPLAVIRKYKNERLPNIAVTVDLLTTGVDVPEICNLVFLRRVRSRILYEQMMGRATRLCDRLKKTHFNVFDAVGLYEMLEQISSMKPVVANPKVSLTTLASELEQLDQVDQQRQHIESIIAKIQRKQRRLDEEDVEIFITLSGGQKPEEFLSWLRQTPPQQVKQELPGKIRLLQFLEQGRYHPTQKVVSFHADRLLYVARGYGKGTKPQDYLAEFGTFIRENMNKITALQIVVQRPQELTRQALRELKIELDSHGFSETSLNTAWRELKNEDIAADIISFIRQQALGDALVSHEERIKQAMQRVRAIHPWNKVQQGWLDRIEKQLIKETILDRDSFDQEPFRGQGGFLRINKLFGGKLEEVLKQINQSLYERRNSAS
ncbi:type I restriction-modification system endonuclease [Desulfotomaculum defluvii]